MFGKKTKLAQAAFNADVLTTFGKLSQQDIDKIDGNPERLVAELIEQYGWQADVARHRVIGIGASLEDESKIPEVTATPQVKT